MTGWYEIAKNDKGQFSFVLKAANSQVILRSQPYESKASAQGGIASVQANSALDDR
ncbi:MAG: YegP family protein, partial [Rubrivivax sp.]